MTPALVTEFSDGCMCVLTDAAALLEEQYEAARENEEPRVKYLRSEAQRCARLAKKFSIARDYSPTEDELQVILDAISATAFHQLTLSTENESLRDDAIHNAYECAALVLKVNERLRLVHNVK